MARRQKPIRYDHDQDGMIRFRKVTPRQTAISCRWLLVHLMREAGGGTLAEARARYVAANEGSQPVHAAARD